MGIALGEVARTSGILDEPRKCDGEDGWNRGVVLWLWLLGIWCGDRTRIEIKGIY